MKRQFVFAGLLFLILGIRLWIVWDHKQEALPVKKPEPLPSPAQPVEAVPPPAAAPPPAPSPLPPPKRKVKKEKKPLEKVRPIVPVAPPEIKIYEELIPKNIEIARVYYASFLTGPGLSIDFDINGSGFTGEFQQMIDVKSGSERVAVKNLRLITVNQIHGTLAVSTQAQTGVAFPLILIQGKVVFRAFDPFAVIRPGEVLNLVFTEMGESGRTGKFRVYTNLTQEMFDHLTIKASTPSIRITDITPQLPYMVDATLNIGPVAQGGNYGLSLSLGGRTIWEKKRIIRIVRPNVGQSGLVQKLVPIDAFHRPGDQALFMIQGSGFLPTDPGLLSVEIDGYASLQSSFSYLAPGRLNLSLEVPLDAKTTAYAMRIKNGEKVLLKVPNAFVVVGENWVRQLELDPVLFPGGRSSLKIVGRGLKKSFSKDLKIEVDEGGLSIGKFKYVSNKEIAAVISADSRVRPGDYWLKISAGGNPIEPQMGSIIRVNRRKE